MKDKIYELIKENEKMIYSIAIKYKNYAPIEDLYQVGVIGIIDAYKHYKMEKEAKFSTFAYKYIMGQMITLVKDSRLIKVSSDTLKLYKQIERVKELLVQKLNKEPNNDEVANFMNIDKSLIDKTILESEFVLSLSTPINEELTIEDTLSIDETENIDKLIALKKELQSLKKEEKDLIAYRYYQGYNQSETAKFLGLSQVQVSRNEKSILNKMKEKIAI